ncbi:MAG: LysM peptidoglycan-binding domain-containing protein [Zoogloeaceae bacterium]|jgi:hypothetical protein|nr:LysM peptidoglycan-binding domain-containing protein [Zoogloeaceae bacterium]
MNRIISVLFAATTTLAAAFAGSALAADETANPQPSAAKPAPAKAQTPLRTRANAPDHYVVQKGDTLWKIAEMYLAEPWRWPEIWRMNKGDIKNPNLIYPGEVVLLDMSGGRPRLRLGKRVVELQPQVHVEELSEAIPAISPGLIEPFIVRPIVDDVEKTPGPRIIALAEEGRVLAGNGDEIFVMGINEDLPRWQIYRPGQPLKDPNTGEVLGYESFHLGMADVVRKGDPVSVLRVRSVKEEIKKGDYLAPAEEADIESWVPRAPAGEMDGAIVSVYGGVSTGGKNSVIVTNLGESSGIAPGDVLAIYSKRMARYQDDEGRSQTAELPEDRYGLVFVFRVFDRVSYALVMEAAHPLAIGDAVRNP